MFLIRLWHYLKGYVIIIVTGTCVERFINICTRRQIPLWDVERITPGSVSMKMSINGFKNPVPRQGSRDAESAFKVRKACRTY